MIALGLYRSASTWVFNILASLSRSETSIRFYSDTTEQLASQLGGDETNVIVKCHKPDAASRLLIAMGRLEAVLSIREPLDCVASLIERFGATFEEARHAVASSAACILATLSCCRPVVLRYEDDERGASTVLRIAKEIGVSLDETEADKLAAEFSPIRVKSFIDRLTVQGVFGSDARSESCDLETHWHPNHLGSGRSGRYAEVLLVSETARVLYDTRRFRSQFGYDLSIGRPALRNATRLTFCAGEGLAYCGDGFGHPEAIGLWTTDRVATMTLPLCHAARSVTLVLHGHFSSALTKEGGGVMHVVINDTRHASAFALAQLQDQAITIVMEEEISSELELKLQFDGLRSASDLGLSGDTRRLGFCLVALDVGFVATP